MTPITPPAIAAYLANLSTAPHAVLMHPGTINRGIEIDGAIADDPARSVILEQVAAGVPVRMACLAAILD